MILLYSITSFGLDYSKKCGKKPKTAKNFSKCGLQIKQKSDNWPTFIIRYDDHPLCYIIQQLKVTNIFVSFGTIGIHVFFLFEPDLGNFEAGSGLLTCSK